MSYSLFSLILGAKEELITPPPTQILVEFKNNRFQLDYDKNSGEYAFMMLQEGVCVTFSNPDPERSFLGACDICDADFDCPKELIKYPYWVCDEKVRHCDLIPLVIFDEYLDEFKSLIRYLTGKSPIGKMMFLARLQAYNPEIICGTISVDDFFALLSKKKILFNTCYILCDDYPKPETINIAGDEYKKITPDVLETYS